MSRILAIDGGSTHTRAARYSDFFTLIQKGESGPSNPLECGVQETVNVIVSLAHKFFPDGALDVCAAGIAGAAEPRLRDEIAEGVSAQLNVKKILITNDLLPILLANAPEKAAVVVVAGTGSSILVQDAGGATKIFGGRGPLIGDDGGAYQIAVAGLRAAALNLDADGPETRLLADLPAAAQVPDFGSLSRWAAAASKGDIARLAIAVSDAAGRGDMVARRCIEEQAERLANQVKDVLFKTRPGEDTPVFLTGGVFDHANVFTFTFKSVLRTDLPGVELKLPGYVGPRAVALLAYAEPIPDNVSVRLAQSDDDVPKTSPTEGVLAHAAPIDTLATDKIVDLMHREDVCATQAVAREGQDIARLIDAAASAITNGGRIIYVGAGTSGRLGVLDAAECPPTFGVDLGTVMALIAGGEEALRKSVEGAEDDTQQAIADLGPLAPPLSAPDIVIGISASGDTPYVKAILDEAGRVGAETALVTCNPAARKRARYVVAVNTGPEVVTGSTRLKAGTATKLVLNMITTGAMARSGYVYEGRMVEMKPVNAKLRNRAVNIVATLAQVDRNKAARFLHDAGDHISLAIVMAKTGSSPEHAKRILDEKGGTLRAALDAH